MDDESRIGRGGGPPPSSSASGGVACELREHRRHSSTARQRDRGAPKQPNVDAPVIGWLLDADVDMTISSDVHRSAAAP